MPKCFKCEKEITSAICLESKLETPWDCPADAVVLTGGDTFGSGLYDAMMDGIYVRVIICDECLQKHSSLLQEVSQSSCPKCHQGVIRNVQTPVSQD